MPFVPDLEPEYFDPTTAMAVTGPDGELKRTWNIYHKLAHSPIANFAVMSSTRTLLTQMKLNPVFRELAICTVARITDAAYSYTHHIALARVVNISEEKLMSKPFLDGVTPAVGGKGQDLGVGF